MSKGKKPEKPLSKKVLALNEQLRRRRETRELGKRFLIVCEDDQSAPHYFEALKKEFSLSATSVRVVGSGGRSQPVQVVDRAIKLKQQSDDPDSGTLPFEEVWCVIDGDYGAKINDARINAQPHGIRLAISTMCFEYWVLLHVAKVATPTVDCDGLVSLLKKRLPDYQKGTFDYTQLVKHVRGASVNARELRLPGIRRGEPPEKQNPCSEVYRLIDAILGEMNN